VSVSDTGQFIEVTLIAGELTDVPDILELCGRFRLVGAIFHPRRNHFSLRLLQGETVISYDGMENGGHFVISEGKVVPEVMRVSVVRIFYERIE